MTPEPRFTMIGPIGMLAIALVFTSLAGCQNQLDKDDRSPQTNVQKGPAKISVENAETVITLDTQTQKLLGLSIENLATTVTRQQDTFPAAVPSVGDLTTFRTSYLAALAQFQKARIEADVASKEYARLKALFDANQSVSGKSLEAAEGVLQADEMDVHAAEQQVGLQKSLVGQQWGDIVAKWMQDDSTALQRILDQHDMLVQMTMPAGAALVAPKSISLGIPDGSQLEANLVSAFPRVDPRIQGKSYLYVLSAPSELAPGTSLVAHLSVGSQMKGVVVPTSAVVWSGGDAWVYQQTAPDRFTRRPVNTDRPVANGFFVAKGFSTGEPVVFVGAQALLSEEFLLRGQGGGQTDND
jgi:multidrug efflux system membrane fusion protein